MSAPLLALPEFVEEQAVRAPGAVAVLSRPEHAPPAPPQTRAAPTTAPTSLSFRVASKAP